MKKAILFATVIAVFMGGSLYAQCPAVNPPIYAGQDTHAGWAFVNNVCENLYISLWTVGDWKFKEINFEVVQDPDDFPTAGNGNPKVGHFTYSYKGLTNNHSFGPIATGYDPSLILGGYDPPLYIAIHVVVVKLDAFGNEILSETGWAYPCAHPNTQFNDRGGWASYFQYCWSPCTAF